MKITSKLHRGIQVLASPCPIPIIPTSPSPGLFHLCLQILFPTIPLSESIFNMINPKSPGNAASFCSPQRAPVRLEKENISFSIFHLTWLGLIPGDIPTLDLGCCLGKRRAKWRMKMIISNVATFGAYHTYQFSFQVMTLRTVPMAGILAIFFHLK